MELHGKRVLLTGASGGLGNALALALARRGAQVGLAGRRREPLEELAGRVAALGTECKPLVDDLNATGAVARVVTAMRGRFGGIDVLINNAGVSSFTDFAAQAPADIETTLRTNIVSPLLLTRAVLPLMLEQRRGAVVNVGSMFGSIAFAWFAGYSASKFALRGFSEALRRELDGSGVEVIYAAPRALRTPLNGPLTERMATAVGMTLDDPVPVAEQIVRAIERGHKDVYIGFPESLFARLNGLLPRLVDSALRRQNVRMKAFLERG